MKKSELKGVIMGVIQDLSEANSHSYHSPFGKLYQGLDMIKTEVDYIEHDKVAAKKLQSAYKKLLKDVAAFEKEFDKNFPD